MTLVYGGGGVGLMEAVADAAIAAGGRVHGVIPEFLTRGNAPTAADELEVTGSMHAARPACSNWRTPSSPSPAGSAPIDETVEIITWRQLGLHDKPVILRINGWRAALRRRWWKR